MLNVEWLDGSFNIHLLVLALSAMPCYSVGQATMPRSQRMGWRVCLPFHFQDSRFAKCEKIVNDRLRGFGYYYYFRSAAIGFASV